MSGIYIPGMEMPTSCSNCVLCVCYKESKGEVYRCGITMRPVKYFEVRLDNCPLVPVTPHGRLIDADALYEKFLLLESEAMSALQTTSIGSVDGIKWSAILTERTGYKFDIVDAPTIIPAEEGEG